MKTTDQPPTATLYAFGRVFELALQSMEIQVAADELSTAQLTGIIQSVEEHQR